MLDDSSGVDAGKTSGPLSGEMGRDVFRYSGRDVRVILIDCEPWFVAADVCTVLDLGSPHKVVAALDEDEKGRTTVPTLGGPQEVAIVNEPGLYALIGRSRKPEAKPFKRWINHEVLPSIRRTGSYGTPALPDLRTPGGILALAEQFAETARQLVAAEQRAAIMAPKAEAYDEFLTAEGDYLIGVVGKMLGIGQNTLFARLRAEHILINGGQRHNTPYQQYMRHFRVVARDYKDSDGNAHANYTTFVKPSGVDFIRKVLKLPVAEPLPLS